MKPNQPIFNYFKLCAALILRQIRAFGIQPVIGIILFTCCYIALSWLLYLKTAYAAVLISVLGTLTVFSLSESRRTTFLLTCFHRKDYYTIRLLENTLVILPFLVTILVFSDFIVAAILFAVALALAFYRFQFRLRITIPTPFSRRPFEFIVGFRKTLLLLIITYSLVYVAIIAKNPQIGLFSMAIVFLLSSFFYASPEPIEFVWMYAMTPSHFLKRKLTTALLFGSVLALPPALITGIFFPQTIWLIFFVFILGLFFLTAMVLSKYAAIPNETDVQAVLLIAFCTAMPPLFLVLLPYLFIRARKNLLNLIA